MPLEGAAKEKVAGVVGTLMTNFAFEQAMAGMNVPFARARVGDRYVLELLRERKWLFGGENSGHILCLDKHTTGDAIVSALQVLHALVETKAELSEAAAAVTLYPQVLINVAFDKRLNFDKHRGIRRIVAEAEKDLAGKGRVLLRASGTEPVIRVMVEGKVQARVRAWAQAIAEAVKKAA